jgi:hypothetical protein
MDYTSLHWGSGPSKTITVKVPAASGKEVGKVEAISYVTKKDQATVYEHKFDTQPPLCETKRGQAHEADTLKLFQIGLVVDIKLTNGVCLVGGGCSVSTDADGRFLVLTSPAPGGPLYQFGNWGDDLAVTDHGIVL